MKPFRRPSAQLVSSDPAKVLAEASEKDGGWVVYVPELKPKQRPHGLTMEVEAAGDVRVLIVE